MSVMTCCADTDPIGRFFGGSARRLSRKFRRRGLAREQRRLLTALRGVGFTGQSVLEIGCGVGGFHLSLLSEGAGEATGVDLAPPMLDEARFLARQMGHEDRARYRLGDFVEIADDLEEADVTVLDKVVCCYPDAETLIRRSTEKTRRTCALTYPRINLLTRSAFAAMRAGLWLIRSKFRPYLHPPAGVQRWIEAAGFEKAGEASGWFWLSQVYVRRPA